MTQTYNKYQYISKEGIKIASASMPSDYEPDAVYDQYWQSEMVPFLCKVSARAPHHGIYMSSYSKELFHELKNPVLKGMKHFTAYDTKNGYQKFMEIEDYLQKEAERFAGGKLIVNAKATPPTYFSKNPQAAANELRRDIDNYATFIGVTPVILNSRYGSILYKYAGKIDKRDITVLAGMDFEGAELDFTPSALDKISDKMSKGNQPFGKGKHVDDIMYGQARSYFCIYYNEYEEEALPVFMTWIGTLIPDPSLYQLEADLLGRKMGNMRQEAAQYQQIAMQKQMELQYRQRQTAQVLADNARAMSDGLMDSWNQKMASDSRISQARSEATMGVNTYTTSYGNNVDVSVTADHVYQNQYGDVYGVSGNALDQSDLNALNWKELKK